ncbi:MAG: C1 family peptidase [Coriobacteriia bacterium]
MARCYDQWPGEKYEGSSARGAMKGWVRHGVCPRELWNDDLFGREHLDASIAKAALETPAGAYYRVNFKEVRHVHAALDEVGIVYCTIMVHSGWDDPNLSRTRVKASDGDKNWSFPVIPRTARADAGHAVALVGYTREGFIIQNSWGPKWGDKGFALLPYEDFLLHATDVWVAQLGVPLSVDLWSCKAKIADTTSGRYRASSEIPLAEIRPFVVDVGNNGELSQTGDYWTCEKDLLRLFNDTIPREAKRRKWDKKRVMLYLHGGLNSEADAARRVVALRDKCLDNGIYPLHLMWETGPLETIADIIGDLFTDADRRAGGALFDGLADAKDMALELTASPIGRPIWSEMKENAWRASDHRQGLGAIQLMKEYAAEALGRLSVQERRTWELHVVAHSAGSILFTHAIDALCSLGIPLKTVQFMAPAIRIDEFDTYAGPTIRSGGCPKPTMYVLTEKQELDDTCGPYGKSLLWLVSNSFEDRRQTPLLGMSHFLKSAPGLRKSTIGDIIESSGRAGGNSAPSTSESHGGFDNDPRTINSVLERILDKRPNPRFDSRDFGG